VHNRKMFGGKEVVSKNVREVGKGRGLVRRASGGSDIADEWRMGCPDRREGVAKEGRRKSHEKRSRRGKHRSR